MAQDYTISNATAEDAPQIAELHVLSWRSAYRGILPDAYLDGDVEPERRAHWEKTFARLGRRDIILKAERNAAMSGFISCYWGKEPGFDIYLDNLHVRPGIRGAGLGRMLFGAAVERAIANGAQNLCLTVFDENEGAIRLYERLGGELTEQGFDDIGGGKAADTRVEWHDLPALLEACHK